jgi:hypothetical protein
MRRRRGEPSERRGEERERRCTSAGLGLVRQPVHVTQRDVMDADAPRRGVAAQTKRADFI